MYLYLCTESLRVLVKNSIERMRGVSNPGHYDETSGKVDGARRKLPTGVHVMPTSFLKLLEVCELCSIVFIISDCFSRH